MWISFPAPSLCLFLLLALWPRPVEGDGLKMETDGLLLFSSFLIGLVFLEEQAGLHLHVTYQQQAQAFHTDSITERRMRKFAVLLDYSPFSFLLVIVLWLLRVILFDCYAICDSVVWHGSGNAGGCFCMLLPTDVWRFQCGSVGGVQGHMELCQSMSAYCSCHRTQCQDDVMWGVLLGLANTGVILYRDLFCSELSTGKNGSCSSFSASHQCYLMFLSFLFTSIVFVFPLPSHFSANQHLTCATLSVLLAVWRKTCNNVSVASAEQNSYNSSFWVSTKTKQTLYFPLVTDFIIINNNCIYRCL